MLKTTVTHCQNLSYPMQDTHQEEELLLFLSHLQAIPHPEPLAKEEEVQYLRNYLVGA